MEETVHQCQESPVLENLSSDAAFAEILLGIFPPLPTILEHLLFAEMGFGRIQVRIGRSVFGRRLPYEKDSKEASPLHSYVILGLHFGPEIDNG